MAELFEDDLLDPSTVPADFGYVVLCKLCGQTVDVSPDKMFHWTWRIEGHWTWPNGLQFTGVRCQAGGDLVRNLDRLRLVALRESPSEACQSEPR